MNHYEILFSNVRTQGSRPLLQRVVVQGSEPLVAWLRFEALYPKRRFVAHTFDHA